MVNSELQRAKNMAKNISKIADYFFKALKYCMMCPILFIIVFIELAFLGVYQSPSRIAEDTSVNEWTLANVNIVTPDGDNEIAYSQE